MSTGSETGRANASRIAWAIWQNPMISRGEIADRLKLERSTITQQVSRLLDLGLVAEVSEGRSGPNGGRRPIQLGINKDYGFVVGIEADAGSYSAVAMNMAGDALRFKKGPLPLAGPASSADGLAEVARSFSRELDLRSRLLGVGIALGRDATSDTAQSVSDRLKVPVSAATGAQCCAWSELAFRGADGPTNFLFALVRREDDGNGAVSRLDLDLGLVIDGKVHPGNDLAAQPHGEYRSPSSLARHLALFANAFVFDTVYVGGDADGFGDSFLKTLVNEMARVRGLPALTPRKAAYATRGDRAIAYGAAGMQIFRILSWID